MRYNSSGAQERVAYNTAFATVRPSLSIGFFDDIKGHDHASQPSLPSIIVLEHDH